MAIERKEAILISEKEKKTRIWFTLICKSFLMTTTLSATMVSSFFDINATSPFKHASVTSGILLAHRPMAWIVCAPNSLSVLKT